MPLRSRRRASSRWRAVSTVVALFVAPAMLVAPARGAEPTAAPSPPTSPPPPAPAAENRGLAVLALAGAESAAWSLAQAVYATDALRPRGLDEAHARILAGAPPAAGAGSAAPSPPADARDLADTRAAIHGDDAPSRAILASIANTFHVRGIVVVEMRMDTQALARPSARVFLAESGGFDAARYEPDAEEAPRDAGSPPIQAPQASGAPVGSRASWAGATRSLARAFAPPAEGSRVASREATALATSPVPPAPSSPRRDESPSSHAFYTSPWFWGAVGAAAFGGAAVYFATRDNSGGTIHLQMQVPK